MSNSQKWVCPHKRCGYTLETLVPVKQAPMHESVDHHGHNRAVKMEKKR